MELRQLEYFRCVAEYSNFTKASEELHVSQPAITTAVKNLEDELGFKLFIRERKGVILTREGEQFLETSNQIFAKLNSTVTEIRTELSAKNKILNLGVAPVAGALLISQIYGDFLSRYKDYKINMYEMGSYGMTNAIDNDQIDLAFIVILDEHRTKYEYEVIEKNVVHVVLNKNHPLAACEKLTLEQLKDESVFSVPRHSFVGRKTEEAYVKAGIIPNIAATPAQMFTTFNLISHNDGISFVLGDGFTKAAYVDQLVSVPLDPPITYEIGFVWKKNKELNDVAKKLMKYARMNLKK